MARYRRVLDLWERAFGPNHIQLIRPLLGLAAAAELAGSPAEALAFAERCLALTEGRDDAADSRASCQLAVASALVAGDGDAARAQLLLAAARSADVPAADVVILRQRADTIAAAAQARSAK